MVWELTQRHFEIHNFPNFFLGLRTTQSLRIGIPYTIDPTEKPSTVVEEVIFTTKKKKFQIHRKFISPLFPLPSPSLYNHTLICLPTFNRNISCFILTQLPPKHSSTHYELKLALTKVFVLQEVRIENENLQILLQKTKQKKKNKTKKKFPAWGYFYIFYFTKNSSKLCCYFILLNWIEVCFFFFFCKIFFRQVDVACQCQKQFGKSCSRLEAQIKAAMGVGLLQHWKGYYRMFWISVYKIFYFILFPHLFHYYYFDLIFFCWFFFPSFFALIFFLLCFSGHRLQTDVEGQSISTWTRNMGWRHSSHFAKSRQSSKNISAYVFILSEYFCMCFCIFLCMFLYYLNISACMFLYYLNISACYLNISACVFVFFCVCFYIIWIFLHMFLDFLYLDMFIYFCVHVYIFLCTCLCISSYVWFKVR